MQNFRGASIPLVAIKLSEKADTSNHQRLIASGVIQLTPLVGEMSLKEGLKKIDGMSLQVLSEW